jgi:hypothetical protein
MLRGQLHASAAIFPGKEPLVPIGQEADWIAEPVWTLWRREASLVPAAKYISVVEAVSRRYTD